MSKQSKSFFSEMVHWHKKLGLVVGPVLVVLVVTGILLNHSDYFQWSERTVSSPIVGNLYGVAADENVSGFQTSYGAILQRGERVYRDGHALTQCKDRLVGAVSLTEFLVAACRDVSLYLPSGELVETLQTLPSAPQRLGVWQQQLVVSNAQGNYFYDDLDACWLPISATETGEIVWAVAQTLNTDWVQELPEPLQGLDQERFLLDLHSGRLFGTFGVWFVDICALFMLFLAFSGTYTWVYARIKRRANKRRAKAKRAANTQDDETKHSNS